ncbi:hypothetical protein ABMC89_14425 [Sulfitobacter sp. HNIBRBA3233]|uniref:hypothetical protein n=1 Tax=Sulfitobacter marinivivus TaxID=3158558 RepID=UPI0032DFDAC6
MRLLCAFALGALVAGCGALDADEDTGYTSPRQQPSVTTPGISLSGYANVGVIRRY